MFTGLIEGHGTITHITPLAQGLRMTITHPFQNTIQIGESISINGACTTALNPTTTTFEIDLLEETLKKTSFSTLKTGDPLNLERSVTPSTRLGGHMVQGHIDETATIISFQKEEPWAILTLQYSPQNRIFLVPKGSICIDGISLTLVEITDTTLTCHLIPHTLEATNLSKKKEGDIVNLEYDILGKYLYNFYTYGHQK